MATLTPQIAQDLMWRSMTTGVPTSELEKYGGYDKVNAMYASNGGGYGFDEMTPEFLDAVDDIVASTGVGNLAVLAKTGTPLSSDAYQRLASSGVGIDGAFLNSRNIPYEGFLKAPPKVTNPPTGSTSNNQTTLSNPSEFFDLSSPAAQSMLSAPSAAAAQGTAASPSNLGGWNARQAMGAADSSLLGAGNAAYNSSLIKSLRQNSLTPFSTNPGVLMAPNQGASTSSLVSSMDQMGGAFNPQVLNPRTASDQEVSDWNAYSTYRTNSLNAKTPILSMAEWLAGGKSDGKAPTNTTPTPDYYDYSAGA